MLTVNLFDSTFGNSPCSVSGRTPVRMRYVYAEPSAPVTIFTDAHMLSPVVDTVDSPIKIGWLHESRALHGELYDASIAVRHKFTTILTYDQALLGYDPEIYRFVPHGGSWIPEADWCMPTKTKFCSLILSDKTTLPGHQLRHWIADHAEAWGIDCYGPEYTPIINKNEALRDYCYSIVVEPVRETNYFTEHLLDCIALGVLPVYWGCPNISQFFVTSGMRIWDTLSGLELLLSILRTTASDPYEFARTTMTFNQQHAREYAITEDWIVRNILSELIA